MIRVCGETVSTRLSRRLQTETISVPMFEKRSLFSNWLERACKRIQKIVFTFSFHSVSPQVLIPSFPQEKLTAVLGRTATIQSTYENVILLVSAIFSLFVSIFYQSSEEPASKLGVCGFIRDGRREVYASLLSSLLFMGLTQEVVQNLQYRIFVMEKSYV